VFAPSAVAAPGYVRPPEALAAPETGLELEFVHGYHNAGTFTTAAGAANVFYLCPRGGGGGAGSNTGGAEIVYYSSAVCVIYNRAAHTQRFFMGHDDDVTAMAVHPNGVIVATGQAGREPPICVWDSGAGPWHGSADAAADGGGGGGVYPKEAAGLCELHLHTRAVVSLDFSADGKVLCSVGSDAYHTVALWDWDEGVLLCTARGHNAPVSSCRFNPYQYVGIGDDDHTHPGQARTVDEVCYTLVSCGARPPNPTLVRMLHRALGQYQQQARRAIFVAS